jgi:hypothetical protein
VDIDTTPYGSTLPNLVKNDLLKEHSRIDVLITI